MKAKDLMTTDVITVGPDALVRDIAQIMLRHHISAVPVVGASGKLEGIVSEGDLMRRADAGTERHRSWWLGLITSPEEQAQDYVKSHAIHARDVMSTRLVTVDRETPVSKIAALLEEKRIKRVPVVEGGRVVGVVSRADLLHCIATTRIDATAPGDAAIRDAVAARIREEAGVRDWLMNVTVADGAVHLWGGVRSESERRAARVAAETVAGVKSVEDHLSIVADLGAA